MAYDPTKNRAARNLEPRPQLSVLDHAASKGTGEFKKGLRAGFNQVSAISEGVQGIGNALIGDDEAVRQNTLEANKRLQDAAFQGPSIKQIEEINSVNDFGKWVAGTFGQVLPVMAPMVAGG